VAEQARGKLRAGLDPRQRIYRDQFNEYFVFILSATGAAIIVPLLMLVVSVVADRPAILPFLAASVAAELLLIFGLARPAMRPGERLAWAALWGGAALFFGFCFYHLVVSPLV
jgi:hypothetical protein